MKKLLIITLVLSILFSTVHVFAQISEEEDTDLASLQRQVKLLSKQVQRLEEAISPKTPQEVAFRWAEGIMTRNGALEFALLSNELREKVRNDYEMWEWSFPPGSSPRPLDFEVRKEIRNPDGSWQFEILYYIGSSTGITHTGTETITVSQYDGRWCLSNSDRFT
ncbi:hypothetical protein [Ammoniphilus sp. 3BR4]|uniref:hypothetical protein n=1 Tax=Ammoniphilus sp. 3BR4 TaxID=3158265 RepID=UPI00346652E9